MTSCYSSIVLRVVWTFISDFITEHIRYQMASKDDPATGALWERYSNVLDEPRRILSPVAGFAKMSLVSLEEAIRPLASLVSDIEKSSTYSEDECKELIDDRLLIEQPASIKLYTMQKGST